MMRCMTMEMFFGFTRSKLLVLAFFRPLHQLILLSYMYHLVELKIYIVVNTQFDVPDCGRAAFASTCGDY